VATGVLGRTARRGLPGVLAALVLLLAACGGDTPPEGASVTPAAGEQAGGSSASATPSPTPPPWPVAAAYPVVARARITTDNLNVRAAPSTTGAAIGLLQPDDDVGIAGRSPDSQWLAVADTGWIVHRAEWVQLSADIRGLPAIEPRTFVPAMHPPVTTSGYPVVDVVVETVLAQDIARIRQMVVPLTTQCQNAPGMGGPPPCSVKPGATPNTPIEVFPTSVCEGEHVLPERLAQFLPRLYQSGSVPNVANVPLRLYAVIEGPKEQSQYFPDGRWVAVFAQPDGTGRAVGITEQGIVRIDLGCDAPATALVQRRPFEATLFTLPPVLATPVRPRP